MVAKLEQRLAQLMLIVKLKGQHLVEQLLKVIIIRVELERQQPEVLVKLKGPIEQVERMFV